MATPTIEAISTQDITIDTDYALEIGITNDPEEVTVGGLLEGFHYSWDAANDTLTIAGEATRLLGDAIWVVSAKETSSSTAVTREITYNVVSSAPIIVEMEEQEIYRGVENDIFIEVQNKATQIVVDGLLSGLKFETGSEGEGDDVKEGVRIKGVLPREVELTVESTNFDIDVMNDGGEDSYSLPISFVDAPNVYLLNDTDNELYKISPVGSLLWTYDIAGSDSWGFQSESDAFYLFSDDNSIIKLDPSDGTLLLMFTVSGGDFSRFVVGSDGIYAVRRPNPFAIPTATRAAITKWSLSGSLLWTYELTAISEENPNLHGPIVGSDGVYLLDDTDKDLYKISLSGSLLWKLDATFADYQWLGVTSDGVYTFTDPGTLRKLDPSDGAIIWGWDGPGLNWDDPVIGSDAVYLFDDTSDDLYKFRQSDGTLLWEYNAPTSGYNAPVVGFDGIYLFNNSLDVTKVNLTDGTLLWTYSAVSGGFSPLVVAPDGIYLLRQTLSNTDNPILYKVSLSGTLLWSYDFPDDTYRKLGIGI